MMRLGMMAQSIKNLTSIWKNDDLTLGEKWIQTLTSAGMIIPSLITLIKLATTAKNKYTVVTTKEAIAEAKASGAKVVMKGNIDKETVAVIRNTTAWYANPIFWIGTVIMAAVAAFSIYNGIIEKNTKLAASNAEANKKVADENAKKAEEEV